MWGIRPPAANRNIGTIFLEGSQYSFAQVFTFYQPFDPAILILGIYPKTVESFSRKIFILTNFIAVKNLVTRLFNLISVRWNTV